jgi:hypothetical protein
LNRDPPPILVQKACTEASKGCQPAGIETGDEHATKARRVVAQQRKRFICFWLELCQVVLSRLRVMETGLFQGARHEHDIGGRRRDALRIEKRKFFRDSRPFSAEPAQRLLAEGPRAARPLGKIGTVRVLGVTG